MSGPGEKNFGDSPRRLAPVFRMLPEHVVVLDCNRIPPFDPDSPWRRVPIKQFPHEGGDE